MKKILLASACALALGGISNAYADGWAASIDGDYTRTQDNIGHFGCPSAVCNGDGYDVNGAVDLPWTWLGIGLEINGASRSTGHGHDTQGGGSFIWDGMPNFRFAGTVVYNSATVEFTPPFLHFPEWQTGVGAEWYPTSFLTLSAQAGGIEGKFHGGYFGGTIKGYICPDLSLAGYVNYTGYAARSIITFNNHETDFGVKAEWLFSQDIVPLALTARWEHTDYHIDGGTISPDSFFVGLKLYLDESMAPKSLVERNRTGTLDTIGVFAPLGLRHTIPF